MRVFVRGIEIVLVIRGGTMATPQGSDIRIECGMIVIDGDRIVQVAYGEEALKIIRNSADSI